MNFNDLALEAISQLLAGPIVKGKLTVQPTTSSNAETPQTAFTIGKILTGRRDLTSHWLRELSVTDLIAACQMDSKGRAGRDHWRERERRERRGY